VHPGFPEGGEDPIGFFQGIGASHLGRFLAEYGGIGADPPFSLQAQSPIVKSPGKDQEFVEADDIVPRKGRHERFVRISLHIEDIKARD